MMRSVEEVIQPQIYQETIHEVGSVLLRAVERLWAKIDVSTTRLRTDPMPMAAARIREKL